MTANRVPRLVQLLAAAFLVGGAAGALGTFSLTEGIWVWPMSALAMRFLAAAASAYAVGGLLALRRRTWPANVLLMSSAVVYAVPLLLALALRTDPIDWSRAQSWGFVAIITVALAISVYYLTSGDRWRSGSAEPLSGPLRVGAMLLGTVALVVGVIVFSAPRQAGFIWPWAELGSWKVLDSRLIASMLITIGAEALLVAWWNDRAKAAVFLPMLWAYGVMAILGLALHAAKTPALRFDDLLYSTIFLAIVAGSVVIHLTQDRLPRLATSV
ncbi:MAG TPA: hypothetical protein VFU72_11180 [Nitrolancea sp.]|nr:hypothetical protein [Nitrolancea sp.]